MNDYNDKIYPNMQLEDCIHPELPPVIEEKIYPTYISKPSATNFT